MKIKQLNYKTPVCESHILAFAGVLCASFVGEYLVEDNSDANGVWGELNN